MQNRNSSDKISAIKKHLRATPKTYKCLPSESKTQRVQKNLSLLKSDADRLKHLAGRDGLSQAALLSAALDAYEKLHSDTQ